MGKTSKNQCVNIQLEIQYPFKKKQKQGVTETKKAHFQA